MTGSPTPVRRWRSQPQRQAGIVLPQSVGRGYESTNLVSFPLTQTRGIVHRLHAPAGCTAGSWTRPVPPDPPTCAVRSVVGHRDRARTSRPTTGDRTRHGFVRSSGVLISLGLATRLPGGRSPRCRARTACSSRRRRDDRACSPPRRSAAGSAPIGTNVGNGEARGTGSTNIAPVATRESRSEPLRSTMTG
jgi:hypothetical protein